MLSGADDVCVYSIGGGNGNGKNSPRGKNAQLTCWNSSQVTASEWIDNDNFIIGEASGMITIDKANQDYFRQVQYTHALSFFVSKTVLVGPKWFWSDQIDLDLTIMIWS